MKRVISISLICFLLSHLSAQTILKEKVIYEDPTGKERFNYKELLDFDDLGVGMVLDGKFLLISNDLDIKFTAPLPETEGYFAVANVNDNIVLVGSNGKGQMGGLRAIKDLKITIIDAAGKPSTKVVPLSGELTNITSFVVHNGHLFLMSYLNDEGVRRFYTLDIGLDFGVKMIPLKLKSSQGAGTFTPNEWTFVIQDGQPIAYEFYLNSKREIVFNIATLKEDGSLDDAVGYTLPLGSVNLENYLEPRIFFDPYGEYFYVHGLGTKKNLQTSGVYMIQYKLSDTKAQGLAVFPFTEIDALTNGLEFEGRSFYSDIDLDNIYRNSYNGYDIKTGHIILTVWGATGWYELQVDSTGKIDHIDKYLRPVYDNSIFSFKGLPQPKEEYKTMYNKSGLKDKPTVQLMKKVIAGKTVSTDMVWRTIQRDGYDLIFMIKGKKLKLTAYKAKDNN